MKHALSAGGLSALAALATTWPWPLHPARAPGARDLEAGDHLWALWLGSKDGMLTAKTARIGAPEGYTWVVGDPAHVPVFAFGDAVAGAGLGLGLVQLLALGLAAVAAWAWARECWPDRPSVAVLAPPLAVASPGLGLGLVTGMTEAQPLGLTALALLALLRAARLGTPGATAVCALAFGALPWFGPYPALYGVLLAPFALLGGLLPPGSRARLTRVGAVVAAATAALVLAAPVLVSVLSARAPTLPGGTAITARVLSDPELPLNRMLGADLLGLFLPGLEAAPTGVHGAYLGTGAVAAAAMAVGRRSHRRWVPVTLVAACVVLALGFTLQAGGSVLRVGGAPLLAPAGALSLMLEELGRAPRWTRMATLGSILLAPVAAAGLESLSRRVPSRAAPLLLGCGLAALVADAIALGPAPFPRPTFAAAPPSEFDALDTAGSVLELPAPRYSTALPETGGGARARLRHPTLVWQTGHGRSLSGNPHQAGLAEGRGAHTGQRVLDAAVAGDAAALEAARATALEQGFVWAVAYRGLIEDRQHTALEEAWGPPVVEGPALSAW